MHIQVTGSGPDVVLLHGAPGSRRSWDAVVADLAPDHRVHVPDLLGFGESPHPQGADALAPPAQAAALADSLDAETAVVAGHDYGAPVALEFAAAHPQRVTGAVLAATNAFPDTPVPFPLSTLFLPLAGHLAERLLFSRASLRMMLRQGTGSGGRGPDPAAALGDEDQLRAIQTIFASSLRQLRERYAPVETALRGLEVPTEVVWGDRDPFFPVAHAHRTAAAAPGCEAAVILPDAGHFLPDERPAELAAAIRRAVTRAGARTRPSPARSRARAAAR